MEEFINEFHPQIHSQYQRYLRRNNPPKIGAVVKTLICGFGGLGGQILTVSETNNEKYSTLKDSSGDEYILRLENWWKKLEILSE